MTTVIHSARLVDDGEVTDDAWVAFADGVVLRAGTGDEWRALPAGDAIDAAGAYLTPGFVDIHGHGGGGGTYEHGLDAIAAARAEIARLQVWYDDSATDEMQPALPGLREAPVGIEGA